MVSSTSNKQAVLAYIQDYWRTVGYSPSIRDIMTDLHISSTSMVAFYLAGLERDGLLCRGPRNIARSIRLTGGVSDPAAAGKAATEAGDASATTSATSAPD